MGRSVGAPLRAIWRVRGEGGDPDAPSGCYTGLSWDRGLWASSWTRGVLRANRRRKARLYGGGRRLGAGLRRADDAVRATRDGSSGNAAQCAIGLLRRERARGRAT
jgi:hypothetical protein